MKANKTNLFRIEAPKVAVKTVGFVDLISRTKGAQTENKTTLIPVESNIKLYYSSEQPTTFKKVKLVRIFKTKAGRNIARKVKALKVAAQRAKVFAASFLKSARLESAVNDAKKAMQQGYKQFLTHAEKFTLYVDFCRACNALRSFKYSLPKFVRVNLF